MHLHLYASPSASPPHSVAVPLYWTNNTIAQFAFTPFTSPGGGSEGDLQYYWTWSTSDREPNQEAPQDGLYRQLNMSQAVVGPLNTNATRNFYRCVMWCACVCIVWGGCLQGFVVGGGCVGCFGMVWCMVVIMRTWCGQCIIVIVAVVKCAMSNHACTRHASLCAHALHVYALLMNPHALLTQALLTHALLTHHLFPTPPHRWANGNATAVTAPSNVTFYQFSIPFLDNYVLAEGVQYYVYVFGVNATCPNARSSAVSPGATVIVSPPTDGEVVVNNNQGTLPSTDVITYVGCVVCVWCVWCVWWCVDGVVVVVV